MTKWLRKKHLKKRYGDVSYRTIKRWREDGRLPPPEHPFGNSVDAWREDVLDAHDLANAAAAAEVAKSAGPVPVDPAKTASALQASLARANKIRAKKARAQAEAADGGLVA